jgi:hypothetical protein
MKNKIERPEVFIDLETHNFVLIREEDNKQIPGSVIKFIEWNENGTGKASHDTPAPGRSIVVDPIVGGSYVWLTSEITEVISDTKFKTLNSTYTLHKL